MATSLHKFQVALKTCEEHPNEELSCFCKTCKMFICTTCAKTTHNGHDWDFIPIVAKKRRKETPILCRRIKQDSMPRCREKLRAVEGSIADVEKASNEDVKRLEERRRAMIYAVNQIIDEQKRKRTTIKEKASRKLQEDRSQFRTKIEYLEKMTTSLDSNIGAYTDFDVIEMEIEMLRALTEFEAYDVGVPDTEVTFVPGEINREVIQEMIGRIEEREQTNMGDNMSLMEIKTFEEFDNLIRSIDPISYTQAWVGSNQNEIKRFSVQSKEMKSIFLPPHVDFIALSSGDFIVTGYKDQVIRRVTSAGEVSEIVSTTPLHPQWISKTHKGDVLVTLRDDGDAYKLQPSSRRLVQRMTLTGKILHTYEFREDGVTRLFTEPGRTTENRNSDICVINSSGSDTGELIVLCRDGRVRATYRGQEGSEFDPRDVECDSKKRIIVLDCNKETCLHLLGPDGTFLRYLLSDMSHFPHTLALYQDNLWIGFQEGMVKVYTYLFNK